MPTEKEIEAAMIAFGSCVDDHAKCWEYSLIWPSDWNKTGRMRDAFIAALKAAEKVRFENQAAMSAAISEANDFAIAQWPCSKPAEKVRNEKA